MEDCFDLLKFQTKKIYSQFIEAITLRNRLNIKRQCIKDVTCMQSDDKHCRVHDIQEFMLQ